MVDSVTDYLATDASAGNRQAFLPVPWCETMETTITRTGYDFGTGLQAAFANALAFIPNFLAFLVILIVGFFVAKGLGKALDAVLDRVGFDKMVEQGGIKEALSRSGYHVSDILGKIAFYTIFLFVLQLAFGVFGPNPISALLTNVIAFLPNIFVAIVIVVIAASISKAVREVVFGSIGGLSYGRFLANAAAISILVIGAFAALNQLNIAPEIVNGLFYAMLAIVVGVAVVAIGGAGIQPMRSRWENALNAIETEAPRVRREVAARKTVASNDSDYERPGATSGGYVS
jgi:hypothetical protein